MSKKSSSVSGRFSTFLQVLAYTSLIGIFIAFALYGTGLIPAKTAPDAVPSLWHLSAEEYRQQLDRQKGWEWILSIAKSDNLSFAVLVFCALVIPASLVSILPIFIRSRDWWYVAIVSVQSAILVLAASGLIKGL